MLINYLILVVSLIVSWLFSLVPVVTSLPFGVDNLLKTVSGYFYGAIATLPYLQVVLQCFLFLVIFETILIGIKFILGSRAPHITH